MMQTYSNDFLSSTGPCSGYRWLWFGPSVIYFDDTWYFSLISDSSSDWWNTVHNMQKRNDTGSVQAKLPRYTGTVSATGVWMGHWSNGIQFNWNANYILCCWSISTVNIPIWIIYFYEMQLFERMMAHLYWIRCNTREAVYQNGSIFNGIHISKQFKIRILLN